VCVFTVFSKHATLYPSTLLHLTALNNIWQRYTTYTDKLLATSWIPTHSLLCTVTMKMAINQEHWRVVTPSVSRGLRNMLIVCINELDFTSEAVKVAQNSCFQSNELLLTSNYNSLSVREP